MRRATGVLLALHALLAAACHDVAAPAPRETRPLVTDDIGNFWRAYDAGGRDGDAGAFQRLYLDAASAGLRDFAAKRAVTAQSLAQMVLAYPRYFAAVREPMLRLAIDSTLRARVRAGNARLGELYPPATFAPVTLLVGRFSTAGTTSGSGILIGAEFYAIDSLTPLDELGAFQRANVHAADSLELVIAHESIHVQQAAAGSLRGAGSTLLEQALMEGSADFLGELVSGGIINGQVREWGLAHEAAVWADFQTEMSGTDVSRWLYNQGTATVDRPGDLGYFVGYRIAQAYYDRQADKRAAVRDIIALRDARAFLTMSGYAP